MKKVSEIHNAYFLYFRRIMYQELSIFLSMELKIYVIQGFLSEIKHNIVTIVTSISKPVGHIEEMPSLLLPNKTQIMEVKMSNDEGNDGESWGTAMLGNYYWRLKREESSRHKRKSYKNIVYYIFVCFVP